MSKYIATFYSHFGAMEFGRKCKKEGIEYELMPVPRKLSASCGTCVGFSEKRDNIFKGIDDFENCYVVLEDGNFGRLF